MRAWVRDEAGTDITSCWFTIFLLPTHVISIRTTLTLERNILNIASFDLRLWVFSLSWFVGMFISYLPQNIEVYIVQTCAFIKKHSFIIHCHGKAVAFWCFCAFLFDLCNNTVTRRSLKNIVTIVDCLSESPSLLISSTRHNISVIWRYLVFLKCFFTCVSGRVPFLSHMARWTNNILQLRNVHFITNISLPA